MPPGPPVISTLLAEIYGPTAPIRRETALEVEKIFKSVPYIVDVDNSFGVQPAAASGSREDRDQIEFFGLSDQEDLRFHRRDHERRGGRLFPSRRGPHAARNLRPPAAIGPHLEPSLGHDARRRRPDARGAEADRARRDRPGLGAAGVLSDLPPRRALCRNGHGRACRRIRGADLRHAGRRQRHREARLGEAPEAGYPIPRPARGRVAIRRCYGTANGRSPMSPSATWARRSAWRSSGSIS